MMILVTGATGLVGGHLLWHLLQEQDKVVAIRRKTSRLEPLRKIFGFYTDKPDAYLEKIEWREADVLDADAVDRAMQGISVVYHCAAVVSLAGDDGSLMDINVEGTRIITDAALQHQVKKLCFVSSIAACGFSEDKNELITEDSEWKMSGHSSAYAVSKLNAEQIIWDAVKQGLDAVIVNPGVILGFSGTNSSSAMLFEQVRKGLMFYTYGGSGYVDVRDVVNAMIQLTNSPISGERFILVSENNSNKEIIEWMADGFNKRRPWINMTKTPLLIVGFFAEMISKIFKKTLLMDRNFAESATNRTYYSSEKIKKALDYEFIPIAKCISEVCVYMLED